MLCSYCIPLILTFFFFIIILKNIRTVSKDVGLCKITLRKFNGKESEKNLRENLKMNVGEISLEDVNSS